MKKQFVFEKLYQNAPLILLNSFSGEGLHMQLMASMFQNISNHREKYETSGRS